jgi:hypothetical protein
MDFIVTLIIIFALIAIAALVAFYLIKKKRKRLVESLKIKLFSLQFPNKREEGSDLIKEITKSEHFFSSFAGFNKPIVFEAAVSQFGEEICFYAAVPAKFSEAFVTQVHSVWSNALVEDVGDYNIFHHSGTSIGGYLRQKENYVIPIRTYSQVETDTFQSVLGGLSEVNEIGEGGAIQVVMKPAGSSYKQKIKSILKGLKKGEDLKNIGKEDLVNDFMKIAKGESEKKEENKEEKKEIDEDLVKAVQNKLKKPLFEVNVRVMASGPSQFQAESIYDGVSAGFSQFSSPEHNDLSLVKDKNTRRVAHNFSFRNFVDNEKIILNSEELASVFHFPTPYTETPRVKHLRSKQLPPPSQLPKQGVSLGENIYRGETKNIYVSDEDRRKHFYIIGQTGTGKTSFLTNLVVQDIQNGKGVALLDPHGDSISHILGLIPENRKDDVILFDPTSLDWCMGLNMLEYDFEKPEQKTFVVNEMIGILDKLYDLKATGGPMFEQYMRNALLLLMEDAPNEPATLMEVPRVFSDSDYRNRKLNRISNAMVVNFWRKEAEKAGGEASLSNITPYITSKFGNFIANDYMKVIIGQARSSFNFRKVMDEGKILLVNLSKGKIGELNANLLGMIIIGKILMAALGRADVPEENRRDYNLFIDEFQNFTTNSISSILSEARKYHLNLTIAHQFINQLSDDVKNAVFGNVGSTLSFRVGAADAEVLIKQFGSQISEEDLVNADNFNMYAKLLINGTTSNPFNIHTFPPPPPNLSEKDKLESIVRGKYGIPRQKVEEDIVRRLNN